jgi:hypothetical protein
MVIRSLTFLLLLCVLLQRPNQKAQLILIWLCNSTTEHNKCQTRRVLLLFVRQLRFSQQCAFILQPCGVQHLVCQVGYNTVSNFRTEVRHRERLDIRVAGYIEKVGNEAHPSVLEQLPFLRPTDPTGPPLLPLLALRGCSCTRDPVLLHNST